MQFLSTNENIKCETKTDGQKEREIERDRERESEREGETGREGDGDKESEREQESKRARERDRGRERESERDKESERERVSDRKCYKIDINLNGSQQMIHSKICLKYVTQFHILLNNIGEFYQTNFKIRTNLHTGYCPVDTLPCIQCMCSRRCMLYSWFHRL